MFARVLVRLVLSDIILKTNIRLLAKDAEDLIFGNDGATVGRLTPTGEFTVAKIKADGAQLELGENSLVKSLQAKVSTLESNLKQVIECLKQPGNNQDKCLTQYFPPK